MFSAHRDQIVLNHLQSVQTLFVLKHISKEPLILYQQDITVEDIAQQRDIKTSTVYAHLADAIEVGLLDVHDVVELDEEQYNEIVFIIESLEDEEKGRIKPIYEALDEEYDYGVIRCVQASI